MLKLSKVTSPSHRVARTLHPTWEDSASTSEVQEFFSVSTFQVPNPSFPYRALPFSNPTAVPPRACRGLPARPTSKTFGRRREERKWGGGASWAATKERKKGRPASARDATLYAVRPTRDALLQRLRRDCNLPDRRMPHRKWIRGQHWAAQASLQPSAALCSISNRASCGRAEYSIVEMGKRRSRMSKKGCLKIGRRAGFFVRIV